MASLPVRRVAVIGAGISGVNTAAHLIAEGLDVTVFERSSAVGGVWVLNPTRPLEPTYPSSKASVADVTFHNVPDNVDPYLLHSQPGPCYDGLKNNVPIELLEVSLNKWKPNTQSFSTHDVLSDYIQDTAAKTGVTERTMFDTKVVSIKKDRDVWQVTTSTWDHTTKNATTRDWTFDAVAVASGHYHAPQIPAIKGLAEWKTAFPSRVLHSKSFRNAKGFEKKAAQTVLVIGGSASSTDIAVELSPVAKKVWQSTRDGPFDHPAAMLPAKAKRVAEIRSFGRLTDGPAPASEPIPATVTLVDGRTIDDIDAVFVATGYQFSLPFLPQLHRDDVAPQQADDTVLVTDGQQLHNLHKDIFYIPDPTLAFVGVPFYTATFSLFEFQAITVAAVFAGKTALPPVQQQRAEYEKRVRDKGYGKLFHNLRSQDVEYSRELMAWVNEGRTPAEQKPDGYSPKWITTKEKMLKVPNKKNILYAETQKNGLVVQ
ncbi:FAD dependent oxidoreductase [Grosmannia clavigera kw1407]|uniref:FAD dependent oxidoreductase n=1 Tax=Grosmannia clavigera (strain kw1407 / UAMH 11150) TaxID=655863 RepID=F0XJR9_GROCL|nr:FAD dependent oxidoreductase [Grosmannia clavigera kw1407]EFX02193.1 FAD dependent oxidoreductase [Grosmannia clavigera kw1407]